MYWLFSTIFFFFCNVYVLRTFAANVSCVSFQVLIARSSVCPKTGIRPGSSCRFGVQRTLRFPIMAVLIALTSLGRIMRISSAWKAMKSQVCWLKRQIPFIPRREFIQLQLVMVEMLPLVAMDLGIPWTMQKIQEDAEGWATGIQLPEGDDAHPDGFCEAPWKSCPDLSDPSSASLANVHFHGQEALHKRSYCTKSAPRCDTYHAFSCIIHVEDVELWLSRDRCPVIVIVILLRPPPHHHHRHHHHHHHDHDHDYQQGFPAGGRKVTFFSKRRSFKSNLRRRAQTRSSTVQTWLTAIL